MSTEETTEQAAAAAAPQVQREDGQQIDGRVKFWNVEKGYGFITCEDGGDLFCHRTTLKIEGEKFQAVLPGTAVTVIVSVKDGKQCSAECKARGDKLLPGYSSKLEASQTIANYKPGSLLGTVKFWRSDKGFGFIVPDEGGDDVFVHQLDVQTPSKALVKDEQVCYTVGVKKEGGKPQALNVHSLRPAPASTPVFAAYQPMALYAGYVQPTYPGEQTGTVKWYNAEKGFGFVVPAHGGGDVYFKGSDVQGAPLQTGEAVRYAVTSSSGGKQQAIQLMRAAMAPLKRKVEEAVLQPVGSKRQHVQAVAGYAGYQQQSVDQSQLQQMYYPQQGYAQAQAYGSY